MSDTAYVSALPKCAFCGGDAEYDARTFNGQWANMCPADFQRHTSGRLGTGRGQRLIVGQKPKMDNRERRRALLAAVQAGNFDEAEDLVGDGDITDLLW